VRDHHIDQSRGFHGKGLFPRSRRADNVNPLVAVLRLIESEDLIGDLDQLVRILYDFDIAAGGRDSLLVYGEEAVMW